MRQMSLLYKVMDFLVFVLSLEQQVEWVCFCFFYSQCAEIQYAKYSIMLYGERGYSGCFCADLA